MGQKKTSGSSRIIFIDFTRGLVMAIMAWDHVSGYWNRYHQGSEGLGHMRPYLNTTWFFARFVSHYCAPTFIFLAGTVLALSTTKRVSRGETQLDISVRMIIRGIVLLISEVLVVSPAFGMPWAYFGVIACIGVCLIIFSAARRLPKWLIFALSMIIVLNHNFINLNFIPDTVAWGHYLRVILHEPGMEMRPLVGLYPIFPWIGVMGLGWTFGLTISNYTPEQIKALEKPILRTGILSVIVFFIVRVVNGYGNLVPRQGTSLIDWLYVSKYPPSQAFLLWSLGGMCLFMAYALGRKDDPGFNKGLTGVINQYGRTPLFFYLTHLWIYKLQLPYTRSPFTLAMTPTIGFWIIGLWVLYELCKRYEKLKRRHPKSFLQYI